MFRFIIHASKGLIREQHARRNLMFFGLLAALVALFLGATFFDPWLRAHPLWFLMYWAACAWLTVLALLLALFDLLLVRAAARKAERELAREVLQAPKPPDEDAP